MKTFEEAMTSFHQDVMPHHELVDKVIRHREILKEIAGHDLTEKMVESCMKQRNPFVTLFLIGVMIGMDMEKSE